MDDDTLSFRKGKCLFAVDKISKRIKGCYLDGHIGYIPASEFTTEIIQEAEKLERDLKHARERIDGKI